MPLQFVFLCEIWHWTTFKIIHVVSMTLQWKCMPSWKIMLFYFVWDCLTRTGNYRIHEYGWLESFWSQSGFCHIDLHLAPQSWVQISLSLVYTYDLSQDSPIETVKAAHKLNKDKTICCSLGYSSKAVPCWTQFNLYRIWLMVLPSSVLDLTEVERTVQSPEKWASSRETVPIRGGKNSYGVLD